MEDTLALFSVIVFYLGGGSYAPEVGEFTGEQVGGWEIKPTPFRGGSSKLSLRQSCPFVKATLSSVPPFCKDHPLLMAFLSPRISARTLGWR